MTLYRFILNNLRYYWRNHLMLMLAVSISTAVIVGGLAVGDSVRFTLKNLVDTRLGSTDFAMSLQGRFVTTALANRLRDDLKGKVAPLLQCRGLTVNPHNQQRANKVFVWAVDHHFWQLNKTKSRFNVPDEPYLILNDVLARDLDVQVGQDILIRIKKPVEFSLDAPLSGQNSSFSLRLPVTKIISDQQLGHFSLQSNQIAPYNIFVDLEWLQKKIEQPDLCNTLLVESNSNQLTPSLLNDLLKKHLSLADAGLDLQVLPIQNLYELKSSRIFIESAILQAAQLPELNTIGVFSYFVNQLRHKKRSTPYSMVSALSPLKPTNHTFEYLSTLTSLSENDIFISDWLSQDIHAEIGDAIQLDYYTIGPLRKLQERTANFQVKGIYSISDGLADPQLMPNFPGLADSEHCSDWEPDIPIDLDKIREKDEAYWDQYRGTPKAFISLQAAQDKWTNRFGNLTALRYPADNITLDQVRDKVLHNIDPETLGLFFQPVRQQALAAGSQGMNFGWLFLGFSFFILVSALILVSLLFNLAVKYRTPQFVTLQALGFKVQKIKQLFLIEGLLITIPGIALGLILGIAYTRILILGLLTLWQQAVGSGLIYFHIQTSTIIYAMIATIITASLVMTLSLRKQLCHMPRRLLTPSISENSLKRAKTSMAICIGSFIAASLMVILSKEKEGLAAAGVFFIAGALLLLAAITFCNLLLKYLATRTHSFSRNISGLAFKNMTRNPSRSLAVIILLACGTFIVVAVSANRHDPVIHLQQHSSGTGGFALYAESSIPIGHDLNSTSGREYFSLESEMLQKTNIVPLRLREGDDASCLNLHRAQKPRILGVNPITLKDRDSFTFTESSVTSGDQNPWTLLSQPFEKNIIPVVGDKNTVIWALGLKLNDILIYTDERAKKYQLKIVGLIESSILQGSLIVSEDNFIKMFPSEQGYRCFLIDTPFDSARETKTYLANVLQDVGFALSLSSRRLLRFNAVENTYLAIFQLLGGLGLILGTVGFAIILLRNIMERRHELAMCRAIGFSRNQLQKMILFEHSTLLFMGLLSGLIPAGLAVYQALTNTSHLASLFFLIFALAILSITWLWIATFVATKGSFLDVLKSE